MIRRNVSCLSLSILLLLCASAAFAAVSRENAAFRVEWNESNGGLKSLVLKDDAAEMNWIDGDRTWGEVRAYGIEIDWSTGMDTYGNAPFLDFKGLEEREGEVVSRYARGNLTAEVVRRLETNSLVETFLVRNAGPAPHYFLRGHLGVLTPFNDEYDRADVCENRRCDTHIFTGGEVSWVHALKMAPYPTELLLELEEGSLDGYSVCRRADAFSNDRGDFILHPAPFVLLPGESRVFRWRLKAIPAGSFTPSVRFRHETVFPWESFEIEADGQTHRFPAGRAGEECEFEIPVGGRKCRVRGYVAPPFEELVAARVKFIVRNQQCRDPKSPLDGAFLLWDSEEKRQYFDDRFSDHNASRERLGMGLLLARWLRGHPDAEVAAALDRFEAFVVREWFDPESGAVFNTIGKDPSFKRLYNAPWVVTFWRELHELKHEPRYLDWIERTMRDYYAKGGTAFYPNCCTFSSDLAYLARQGRDITELKGLLRQHVDRLVSNGVNYPPHEVKFEQTIVSPSVAILADWCLNFGKDPKVMEALAANVAILERFSGHQPDHRQAELPIRHWDGYWFGKVHAYGDTLHYWGALSGRAFNLWSEVSGEAAWRDRAENCFRNLLYLFRPDGFASCAYYLPFSMVRTDKDGREFEPAVRGERFDPWANDQDYGLYFILAAGLPSEPSKK